MKQVSLFDDDDDLTGWTICIRHRLDVYNIWYRQLLPGLVENAKEPINFKRQLEVAKETRAKTPSQFNIHVMLTAEIDYIQERLRK